jgi:alpha-galactosidase
VKYLQVSVIAALLIPILQGADLTGRWVAATQTPDGQTRETVIALKAEGDTLSGYMSSPQGDTAISEGKINGNEISFVIVRETGGQERKIQYTGKITADGLLMKMPGFGDRPGRDLLARRVSTDPPKPLPPPVPKIALPPMQDVKPNGLAKTPPMGWNSWNKFRSKVSDQMIREIADAMVKNGMKAAGYVYVNIDDTWEGSRDAQGAIRSNEKFPDMKALAGYVHGKGLKLGIYSSPGPKTCAQFEGSFQHEEQDARTFAAWGIDYLKYDWCGARNIYTDEEMHAVYQKMGDALLKTGRPILYSLCQYGLVEVWKWGAAVGGNAWRTTGDIRDAWESMTTIGFAQDALAPWAKPGHWNDPDMLEVGNGGMTDDEYRTHMSLWAILAAPLLAGNDLRNMQPAILEILTNREVIAVNQDKDGNQGRRIAKSGDQEVWARHLSDGGQAIGLFNRGAAPARMTVDWKDVGITSAPAHIRDLWAHREVTLDGTDYSSTVPAHGVVMLRVDK